MIKIKIDSKKDDTDIQCEGEIRTIISEMSAGVDGLLTSILATIEDAKIRTNAFNVMKGNLFLIIHNVEKNCLNMNEGEQNG